MENEAAVRLAICGGRYSVISRNREWRMQPFSEQNPMVGVIHLYREAENGE
jgi:hypothetical protein